MAVNGKLESFSVSNIPLIALRVSSKLIEPKCSPALGLPINPRKSGSAVKRKNKRGSHAASDVTHDSPLREPLQ